MKKIQCKKCKELQTVAVDLFHSGYIVANEDGTTSIIESEYTPEADTIARCYNCDAEYTASEWESLVVEISEESEVN